MKKQIKFQMSSPIMFNYDVKPIIRKKDGVVIVPTPLHVVGSSSSGKVANKNKREQVQVSLLKKKVAEVMIQTVAELVFSISLFVGAAAARKRPA